METLIATVERHLLGADILDMIDTYFESKESCDKLFYSYWKIPEVRKVLTLPPINPNINKKANLESELFRGQGNRLYKERKFDKALQAYNLAILVAPHPPNITNDEDILSSLNKLPTSAIENYDRLAVAYANRSALLYEMENYKESINDIQRALKYGYPKAKSAKLMERKEKSQAALVTSNVEAMSIGGESSSLETDEKQSLSKSQKKRNRRKNKKGGSEEEPLAADDRTVNVTKTKLPKLPKFHHIFYTAPETLPQSSFENTSGSGYSSAIFVNFSLSKGRYLVAARDINPGEILHVETSRCSTVKIDSKLRLYCTYCLKRAPLALPCSRCSLVVFCSEKCRKNGSEVHLRICSVLPYLVSLQLDVDVCLAFIYFSQYTLREIELAVEDILTDDIDLHYNNKDNIKKPFLKQTNNYKSFYYLEGNISSRPIAALKETASNAIIVLRLLLKLPHFTSEKVLALFAVSPEEKWIKMIGGQIMRMILNFQCNDHCVKEMQVYDQNLLLSQSKEVGYGIYPLLSFINHSCSPNAFNSNYGNTKFLYSISSIAKGEEIADCYGERFVSHSLTERRSNLVKSYHFTCDCIACSNYWPLFEKIVKQISIKCIDCKKPLNTSLTKCQHCNNSSKDSKNKKEFNLKNISDTITKSTVEYNIAVSQLSKFNASEKLVKNITDFIETFDKHVTLPNQLYVQAQEMLGKCMDLLGSQNLAA